MVHFRALLVGMLGIFFFTACGKFEVLKPEPGVPCTGPSCIQGGDGSGEGLSDTLAASVQEKILGDENSLLERLGIGGDGEVDEEAFEASIVDFPVDQYTVVGLTVTRGEAQTTNDGPQTFTTTPITVQLIVRMGNRYRDITFSENIMVEHNSGSLAPIARLVPDEAAPISLGGERSGLASSPAVNAELAGEEIAESVEANEMMVTSDQQRPVEAYISCGADENCTSAAVVLQFVSGDIEQGFTQNPLSTFVTDLKVVVVIDRVMGQEGSFNIVEASVPGIVSYQAALDSILPEPNQVTPEPVAPAPAELNERQDRIATCMEAAGDQIEDPSIAAGIQEQCEEQVNEEMIQECVDAASAERGEGEIQAIEAECRLQILPQPVVEPVQQPEPFPVDPADVVEEVVEQAQIPASVQTLLNARINNCVDDRIASQGTVGIDSAIGACTSRINAAYAALTAEARIVELQQLCFENSGVGSSALGNGGDPEVDRTLDECHNIATIENSQYEAVTAGQ